MKGREMPKEMSWCGNQSIGAKMWHVGEMWPLEREMRDRGGKMRKNEGEILVTYALPACSCVAFKKSKVSPSYARWPCFSCL